MEIGEAAGPASEKDAGKLTYQYSGSSAYASTASSSSIRQPTWKKFPVLSRRELKQQLGIKSGSLPKELLGKEVNLIVLNSAPLG